MSERKFRPLTNDEYQMIIDVSGKITLRELSEKLKMNYSVCSLMIKAKNLPFKPIRKIPKITKKPTEKMSRLFNELGEELLTDDMMREYAYLNVANNERH
jgi:hypothetical protein